MQIIEAVTYIGNEMIVFRVDGNSSIGLGHIMRCLSIADVYKKEGYSSLFITSDNELHQMIVDRGHSCLSLDSNYDHMEEDINQLKIEINKRDVETVYVDSYYVTALYLSSMSSFCKENNITLVYIDDILAFPYSCDILINYNIYAEIDDYKRLYSSDNPVFLLGLKYIPQRLEFQGLEQRIINKNAKNIFVSTGGADSQHIGVEIVKSIISHRNSNDFIFHFILGVLNPDKDEIIQLSQNHNNIILYNNNKNMAKLMKSCDVAISAAGSTLYELCATQTPTVSYTIADNQLLGANCFEKSGLIHNVGNIKDYNAKDLADKIINASIELCNDYDQRKKIIDNMRDIVDGRGADRIVQKVLSYRVNY